MTTDRHLTSPRPNGHAWPADVLADARRTGQVDRLHQGDHKALGEHAGHTHTTKEK